MKDFSILFFAIILFNTTASAQGEINYQTVLRGSNGELLQNQNVGMRISIVKDSVSGTVIYQETHNPNSNENGLVSLSIGDGFPVSGIYSSIDWGASQLYFRIEVDLNGGVNYSLVSANGFTAVPYSKYSENGMPKDVQEGTMLYFENGRWKEITAGSQEDILTFCNGKPIWTANGSCPTVPPSVSTLSLSNITSNGVDVSGEVTNSGGNIVTQRGFCWSTSSSPDTSDNHSIFVGGGSYGGVMSATISGLIPYTEYYVRSYALNSSGITYGNELSFRTSAAMPSLIIDSVFSIGYREAHASATITDTGGLPIVSKGFVLSTNPMPTLADIVVNCGKGSAGFLKKIDGLLPSSTYFIRSFCSSSAGIAFSPEVTFSTDTLRVPTLTTDSIQSLTAKTLVLGGTILEDGGDTIISQGICYSTSPSPTISDNVVTTNQAALGFTISVTGLQPSTLYHIRSFATNSIGAGYGNTISFTTPTLLSVGDTAYGGVVVYVYAPGDAYYDSTAQHGLIAATTDAGVSGWGCFMTGVTSPACLPLHTNIGGGAANTAKLLSCGCHNNGTSAGICNSFIHNGYSDWHLPSIDELEKVYYASLQNHVSGLTQGYYWSSSWYAQGSYAWAYRISAPNSSPGAVGRYVTQQHGLRAVRYF